MNDMVASSIPKQMKTIITLLNLVKSELFITIDHAERCLEMFISERQSNASLQQFIQALQQVRGTLTLIEISGAAELTNLMLDKTISIPINADQEWDHILTVLSTSLFTLRRYLENFESYPCSLPELLIPTINELREINKLPPLHDSYFISIDLTNPSLPYTLPTLADLELFGRLRQMYQIGLLGIIKDTNRDASLRMMTRSIDRLQKHLDDENAAKLCWVASAALESFSDSKMTAFPSRKRLLSRVDQQLRKTQINHEPINEALLKDLLYMICLDNTLGTKALNVFSAFNLTPLPYNNKILEAEITKLAGPGQNAICSFTAAIREELEQTQHAINSFTSNFTDHQELIEALLINLEHLIKTLSLVNLQNAETMLKEQIGILEIHKKDRLLDTKILDDLADVVLHVEGFITNYETNASCNHNDKVAITSTLEEDNSNQYLQQGRQLAIQESLIGFSTTQQNIVAYIESNGDKQYLEKLPQMLNDIYGCLLFLNQNRAAKIIRYCEHYINAQMINSTHLPPTQALDNLADILASLEFFMETETLNRPIIESKVLDLAEESLAALNIPIIDDIADTYEEAQTVPTLDINTSMATTTPTLDINSDSLTLLNKNIDESSPIEDNITTTQQIPDFEFNFNNIQSGSLAETKQEQSTPISTPSNLALESLTPPTTTPQDKPEKTTESQPIATDDGDDITFTSPENWKLM